MFQSTEKAAEFMSERQRDVARSISNAPQAPCKSTIRWRQVHNTFFEASQADGQKQLQKLGGIDLALPVVRCNGSTIGNPPLSKLAQCIGIGRNVDQQLFDLVIVGAGPSG